MTELAPGFFVDSFIPDGKMFKLNLREINLGEGIGGTGIGFAVSEKDWGKIPGAKREELLDGFVRKSADYGVDKLEEWLAQKLFGG